MLLQFRKVMQAYCSGEQNVRNDLEKSRQLVFTVLRLQFRYKKQKMAATGGDLDIKIVRKTNDYAKMRTWFR